MYVAFALFILQKCLEIYHMFTSAILPLLKSSKKESHPFGALEQVFKQRKIVPALNIFKYT